MPNIRRWQAKIPPFFSFFFAFFYFFTFYPFAFLGFCDNVLWGMGVLKSE